MADDLPPGSQNLEDDAPPAQANTEPSTPPVELPQEPPEAGAVDVAGEVMVPLAALKEERGKRQALETKAQRADQLEQYVAANEPMLTLIKQYPDLLRRPADPVPAHQPPAEDPEALEAAKLLDFYTPEGKPDVAKGAAHLALVNRQAQRIADAAVNPMRQQSLQERANANFQLALGIKDASGNPINPHALRAVWQQVQNSPNGVAILADRDAAAFVASAAHGAVSLTTPAGVVTPLRPPVVTEASGGGPQRRAPISELETRVAAERGRDAEHWSKLTKGHVAGRPNLVEE